MIDEHDTRTLLRRLQGELTGEERRRLEERLETEPELRAAAERLERDWEDLQLPPATAPPGFADAVMARVADRGSAAPAWARLAAAAALASGIALGAGLGRLAPAGSLPGALAETLERPSAPTLAERYFEALAELEQEVEE